MSKSLSRPAPSPVSPFRSQRRLVSKAEELPLSIRRLTESDITEYRRVRLEALRLAPEAFCSSYAEEKKLGIDKFAQRLSAKNIRLFGAFQKSKLIGLVGLVGETRSKRAHQATLVSMFVTPRRRREGVGAALLNHALAQARGMKELRYLKLSVIQGNSSARSLYTSRGFLPFGVERAALLVNGRYLDEEYLELRLSKRTS